MATEPARIEANRLYWETDSPVSSIADRLGLSRRALYELLEPIALPEPCPTCGGRVTFENRLARSAGEAVCGSCGAPALGRGRALAATVQATAQAAPSAEDTMGPEEGGETRSDEGAVAVAPEQRLDPVRPIFPAPGPRLGGMDYLVAAGAGLAVGLLATFLLTRRRD